MNTPRSVCHIGMSTPRSVSTGSFASYLLPYDCLSGCVTVPQTSGRSVLLDHLGSFKGLGVQLWLGLFSLYPRGFWTSHFSQLATLSSDLKCNLYWASANHNSMVCWEPRCLSNVAPSLGASRLLQQGLEEVAVAVAGENGLMPGLFPA